MRKIIIILFIILSIKINSQQINPLDFFPHHLGDLWQYIEYPTTQVTTGSITRIDTISVDTILIYYNYNENPSLKLAIDSSIIFADPISWFPWYRLNLPVSSIWARQSIPSWWVHFKTQSNQIIFNQVRLTREYHVYNFIPVGDTNGLPGTVEYLVEGIGLYKITWEGGERVLNGCIINGIMYGTIIEVDDYENSITPSEYSIKSYPNPFNNSTIIQYSLPESAQISIKIYDIIGNEVKELFEGIESNGVYSKMWKPETESSGIYFVVLRTNKSVITHKLLYLK